MAFFGIGGEKEFNPNSPEQQKKSPYQRDKDEKAWKAAQAAKVAKGKDKKSGSQLIWDALGGKVD